MLTVGEATTTVVSDDTQGSYDQSSGSHEQKQEVATSSDNIPVISIGASDGNSPKPHPIPAGCNNGSGCNNDAGQGSPPAKLMKSEPVTVVSEWHCCAICLEELLDTDLKGHSACGASICDTCLQVCVCLSVCLSVWPLLLHVCLSVCLSVSFIPPCLSVCMYILYYPMSVCPSVCLSVLYYWLLACYSNYITLFMQASRAHYGDKQTQCPVSLYNVLVVIGNHYVGLLLSTDLLCSR